MATYRLKRKNFDLVDGVKDIAGGAVETTGKIAKSGAAQMAAGGFGAYEGAALGATTLGAALPVVGHAVGAIGGGLLGMAAGKTIAKEGGQAVANLGQDIKNS